MSGDWECNAHCLIIIAICAYESKEHLDLNIYQEMSSTIRQVNEHVMSCEKLRLLLDMHKSSIAVVK